MSKQLAARHLESYCPRSPLQIYLHDINETPLLKGYEELELAERIAKGDSSALDHLVKANLRLVVSIARGWQGKGVSLEDLIGEGNLGLMRAAESFNGQSRFSTYAPYWIKLSIRRAVIREGKHIRLPAYMVARIAKWRRAYAQLSEQLGRPALLSEVAKALDLTPETVEGVCQGLQVHALNQVCGAEGDDASDFDFFRSCVDDKTVSAEKRVEEGELYDKLLEQIEAMATRDPRKAIIVRGRFGLNGDEQTLQQIGEQLSLTREGVRQLETKALRELGQDPAVPKSKIKKESGKAKAVASKNAAVAPDKEASMPEQAIVLAQTADGTAATEQAREANNVRQKMHRRKKIDPTTCNRRQTNDEIELGRVMLNYQQQTGTRHPGPGEILAQATNVLGYKQVAPKVELRFKGGQFEDGLPAAPIVQDQPAIHEVVVDIQKSPGTAEELAAQEFDAALTYYKRCAGRLFPTWSEILEVMVSLGYRKVKVPEPE